MLIVNPNKIERVSQHTVLQMVESRVLSVLTEVVMNLCNLKLCKMAMGEAKFSVIPRAYQAAKGM